MNPRIKSVKPTEDYQLLLQFTDGKQGLYDCKHLLDFGVFKQLKNNHYFKKVTVIDGTVSWPNEQDICPDTLYLDATMLENGTDMPIIDDLPVFTEIEDAVTYGKQIRNSFWQRN
jgi:Protein of unknown function (DUF2442)